MRKIVSILLSVVMVLALAACDSGNTPAGSNETSSEKDMATLSNEAYNAFLKGELEATIINDFGNFVSGQSFHLTGLAERYAEDFQSEDEETVDYDIQYAYIDCGKDGIPELVLRQEIYGDWDGMSIQYILKYDGEKLNLITGFDSYYRYWTDINQYGYIMQGGSGGASSYSADYYYVTADGELVFLYTYGSEMGYCQPVVPYYHLDETKLPEGYTEELYSYDAEDYYCCEHYNFNDYNAMVSDWDSDDYDEKYREYAKGYFYVFSDEQGNPAQPSDEYRALYDELGLKIYSEEEAQDIISAHVLECGLTDELKTEEYPEYKSLWEDESISVVNEDGSVTVNTVQGLVDALDDGVTVYLKPGVYNLSKWIKRHKYDYYDGYGSCRKYDWATCVAKKVFVTDEQFIINRANNVLIASEDSENPAEIIVDSPYSFVVSFCECNGITIKDVVAGHSAGNEGQCAADVFEFNACDNAVVDGCDLYGCGAYGLFLSDSNNIAMNGGCIHDCTYGCVESYDSTPTYFDKVEFRDCSDGYDMFVCFDANMYFTDCSFTNMANMVYLDGGFISFTNCKFDEAAQQAIESSEYYGSGVMIY